MSNIKKEIVFLGGRIEIVPAGTYTDIASGETKKSTAKVKLGGISDKWGNVSPGVFLEMVKAVSEDKEAMQLLESMK